MTEQVNASITAVEGSETFYERKANSGSHHGQDGHYGRDVGGGDRVE